MKPTVEQLADQAIKDHETVFGPLPPLDRLMAKNFFKAGFAKAEAKNQFFEDLKEGLNAAIELEIKAESLPQVSVRDVEWDEIEMLLQVAFADAIKVQDARGWGTGQAILARFKKELDRTTGPDGRLTLTADGVSTTEAYWQKIHGEMVDAGIEREKRIAELEEKIDDRDIQMEGLSDSKKTVLRDLKLLIDKVYVWAGRPTKDGAKNLRDFAAELEMFWKLGE